MGEVKVPAKRYWGAQTQRSLENFNIGGSASRMPLEVIYAFAVLKKSAAETNYKLGVLSQEKAQIIAQVADEILAGELNDEFPLVVWQTGSGTQTNMNVNEVVANRAHVLLGGNLVDATKKIHPNDDVNKSQSLNDTFPTAMHIAAYTMVVEQMLPRVESLQSALHQKATDFQDVVKIGRTHFMDATPLTLGNEFSGYVSQLDHAIKAVRKYPHSPSRTGLGWHCGRYRTQHSGRIRHSSSRANYPAHRTPLRKCC